MTTITLEVPDDLAAQFKRAPKRMTSLLREAATAAQQKRNGHTKPKTIKPLYQELIDFLSSSPSLEQIVKFKIPDAAQERLEELLYKNREKKLITAEETELDRYLQYRHVLILLKASARQAIVARPQ